MATDTATNYRLRIKRIPRKSASHTLTEVFYVGGKKVRLTQSNREGEPRDPKKEDVYETSDREVARMILRKRDRVERIIEDDLLEEETVSEDPTADRREELTGMTVVDLRELAAESGVEIPSGSRKAAIVDAIIEAETAD